jgi:hypothetical protein
MKKILIFLILTVIVTSCYDEFRLDYEHSTVAFSYVTGGSNEPGTLWRSVVKDEGLQLDVGIYLAGILENTEERWADFVIDPELLDGTPYTLMPDDYYSLSNESRFIISAGGLVGKITVTLDSTKFVNDPLATEPTYALPFSLVNTSEDSILATQSTQVVVIKYINHYEGFYIQNGTFETVSAASEALNAGIIENVLEASTMQLDTIETSGSMHLIGQDYKMKLLVNSDLSVHLEYSPNLASGNEPENIAIGATPTTSSVSDWEDINGINDGYQPENSGDKGDIAYGNWPNAMTWNWVQYDFSSLFYIDKSEVYWWTDGGGILIPFNTYAEYWDIENEQWVLLENPVVNGVEVPASDYGVTDTLVYNDVNPQAGTEADQWNVTEFDAVLTNAIRLHFIARESQGILEWQVWGIAGAAGLEMTQIESITPNGTNSFDPETNTFTLNYTVDYKYEDYQTNVSTSMEWRNRIRDGVNEWRR